MIESTDTSSKYHCRDVNSKLAKHSNLLDCLSDNNNNKDNNETPTVESTLVSTTSDEISNSIGMNDNAFYISTDLDQQQQLLDSSPSSRTPFDPSLGTPPDTSPSTSFGTSPPATQQ